MSVFLILTLAMYFPSVTISIDMIPTDNASLTPMVAGYVVRDSQVLLGLRKQSSWDLGKNLVSGIGGKVGDLPGLEHETLDEALVREFKEEIGAGPVSFRKTSEVIFLFLAKPKWNQKVAVYLVEALDAEPQETDAIKPEWYNVNELPFAQMWDDAKYYLPQVLAGQKVSATFAYGPDNRTVVSRNVRAHE